MHADVSEVYELADDIERNAGQVHALAKVAVHKVGFDTLATMQALTPVDTGNLVNSESVDFTDDGLGFEAGPTAEYGGYVEEGTDPHWITDPWGWGDDVRVWHPGTPAQPYAGPAADREFPQLERALGDIGSRAISG